MLQSTGEQYLPYEDGTGTVPVESSEEEREGAEGAREEGVVAVFGKASRFSLVTFETNVSELSTSMLSDQLFTMLGVTVTVH